MNKKFQSIWHILYFFLLAFGLVIQGGFTQEDPQEKLARDIKLQGILKKFFDENQLPSLSAAISHEGQIIWKDWCLRTLTWSNWPWPWRRTRF